MIRADLGVMISASHNPYQDNGIKLFGPDGYKLSDEIELAIEDGMRGPSDQGLASPDRLGRAVRLEGARGRYMEALKASLPRGMSLDGLKIVIDCANGASYAVAPKLLWELGVRPSAASEPAPRAREKSAARRKRVERVPVQG